MPHYTYILAPYHPIREIVEDDLTSYDIFKNSIKESHPHLEEVNEKILDNIGENHTVWGIQKTVGDDNIDVEYYYYTQAPRWNGNPTIAWNLVGSVLGNMYEDHLKKRSLPIDFRAGMFSLDMPRDAETKIHSTDIYHMEPRKGFCIIWNKDGLFNKNKYWFTYTHEEAMNVLASAKVPGCSMLFGNEGKWNESMCLSRKRERFWSIYYSKVSIDTFICFLKRFNYPSHIQDYVSENKSKLDHMYYDIGYDFIIQPGAFVQCLKSGFYGYF